MLSSKEMAAEPRRSDQPLTGALANTNGPSVNGPRNLPRSGPVKFPTGWVSVISRRVDRWVPDLSVAGLGVAALAPGVG